MIPAQSGVFTATVFKTGVTVLVGGLQADGMVPVSARIPDKSAFSRFLAYDAHTTIISVADQEEFRRFLKECRGKSSTAFSVLRAVLVIPIYAINFVANVIRGILGSLVGFGLIGIVIVLAAVALSLLVGIYAFAIAAPFVVASYALNFYEERVYRDAGRSFLKTVVDQLQAGWRRSPEGFVAADTVLLPVDA
jgi:hypothetical protein